MTDKDRLLADALETGTAIVKDGQRITPQDFYIPAEAATRENGDLPPVEEIECVQLVGCDPNAPAPPCYRVTVADRCFDFDTRQEAENLRAAISEYAALSTHQQQGAESELVKRLLDYSNNRCGEATACLLLEEAAAALSRAPQPDRIVSEDELLAALNATQPDTVTEEMLEAAGSAVAAYLDERFPDGALPGGVQLFADPGDHLDPGFKHEKGCTELARAALTAALAARGKPARTSMPPPTESCPHGVRGPANCHTCTPRDPAPQMRWKGLE